jgi:hypothetical protein
MLRVIDPTIETVTSVHSGASTGQELSACVELEWTGRFGTLEGRGYRGDHGTSADACLIGVTSTGERKAFLLEFKYTEAYADGDWKGEGGKGANGGGFMWKRPKAFHMIDPKQHRRWGADCRR